MAFLNENKIKELLEHYEKELVQNESGRINLDFNSEWLKIHTEAAGVYAIFEDGELIYVGETGCLRKRLKDLWNTRHHSLRRTVGHKLFSNRKNYIKATSKIKYPDSWEEELVIYLKNLEIKALPVPFGRKEIEEYLVSNYETLNVRKKRA